MSVLQLERVSRWYGNLVAVNDVSMTIGPGVTGLLGPNGAGKSTVLHMMSGFLPASSGSVALNGRPVWRNPGIYRELGLVPEREAVPGYLTGWNFIHAAARLHRVPDPAQAARKAIASDEMETAQGRRLDTYSKGMRQRIKMASALVHEPSLLLLDEPFNGMDPRQRLHMIDLVRRLGNEERTVLFSSHILEEVERTAEVIQVMVAGRLAASGDFRTIRRLMTNRPHVFTIRCSDHRRLAAVLIQDLSTASVEVMPDRIHVEAVDFLRFTWLLPQAARHHGIRLLEVRPADESLESVFSYLVA